MQDSGNSGTGTTAMAKQGQPSPRPGNVDLTSGATARTEDKSLGQLLGDFSREMSTLVHQEVQLAKVELTEKARVLGKGAGMFAGAAVFGLLGLGALVACAIAALALVLATWLAALIVGVVLLALAGGVAMKGLGDVKKGSPPVPEQALQSTKEDVSWLQNQMKSAK